MRACLVILLFSWPALAANKSEPLARADHTAPAIRAAPTPAELLEAYDQETAAVLAKIQKLKTDDEKLSVVTRLYDAFAERVRDQPDDL